MSYLNDRYDIFSYPVSRRQHLNENFSVDDMFTADDTKSQADVLAQSSAEDTSYDPGRQYEHYAVYEFSMRTDINTPERIKRSLFKFMPVYI